MKIDGVGEVLQWGEFWLVVYDSCQHETMFPRGDSVACPAPRAEPCKRPGGIAAEGRRSGVSEERIAAAVKRVEHRLEQDNVLERMVDRAEGLALEAEVQVAAREQALINEQIDALLNDPCGAGQSSR